jgi:two-component system, NtrC family, sensor kinase
MRTGITGILFLLATTCIGQDSAQVLDVNMFAKDNSVQLSRLNGWVFKMGDDAAGAHNSLNTSNWRKLKPADVTADMADKNGKLEGWFRFKIKLDSSLQDSLPGIGLVSNVWAASDVYINGKLFRSFGNTGLNSKTFKEYNARNKLPVLLPLTANTEYTIAIHFSDKVNQFDVRKRLRSDYASLVILTSPYFASRMYKDSIRSVYVLVGVAVFLWVLTLLFWLIYFQNRKERRLLMIALTASFLFLSWFNITMYFDASFNQTVLFDLIANLSFLLFFIIVPFTVAVILNERVSRIHLISAGAIFVLASISSYPYYNSNAIAVVYLGLSLLVSTYYVISARKSIRGAMWAVVIGLSLHVIYTLLFFIVVDFKFFSLDTKAVVGMVTSLSIFPISLLVYVSMWYKESRHTVEQNAAKILQITEEKRELLESQNISLEKLVAERTRDLNLSLENLRSTQSQLIQSEKMASLGELTAGIAHEIQNPLNFVNNFSELSNELIDEMQESLEKGNVEEARQVAADIRGNLEKVNQHGKRADSIVKSMLQHSRTSSGEKEPTDINALADEYLRLAFHGMRAKDNTFNAVIRTEFDPAIGKIFVVPQDIGRVLLNLFSNAFYAVHDRSKKSEPGYQPSVTVSTRLEDSAATLANGGKSVFITVSDNGDGIPVAIRNKIFQPFFTTKPTGQGTGLGLSLSYDIVTKGHGGSLSVESLNSGGARFIIYIPIPSN